MKKRHNPVGNFYRSENKLLFLGKGCYALQSDKYKTTGWQALSNLLDALSKSLQKTLQL